MATNAGEISFCNLVFRGLHRADLLREDETIKLILTVNAEIIVQANCEPLLGRIINSNWATFDGHWPYILARGRSRRPDLEKISGSDFVFDLCRMAADRNKRVFLLGAAAAVNQEACSRLRCQFGIQVEGYSPPLMSFPFPQHVDRTIMKQIEAFRPDIVLVAFGAPKQEFWADAHLEELSHLGVRWVMAAGGTLDFISGNLKRAPQCIQRIGLESLWRLALQPRVRFRRIVRAIKFLQYA